MGILPYLQFWRLFEWALWAFNKKAVLESCRYFMFKL
jgi:hypothetical protein